MQLAGSEQLLVVRDMTVILDYCGDRETLEVACQTTDACIAFSVCF